MQNELKFRLALRRAARLSLITGKIGLGDWAKVQSVLLNSKRTTPDGVEVDLLDEIANDTVEALKDTGKIGADQTIEAVNWDAILAFIQGIMPTIITFINTLLAIFKVGDEPEPA